MPFSCPGVPTAKLDSINTWKKSSYIQKAIQLAHSFHLDFEKFAGKASKQILSGGPLIDEHYHLEEQF